MNYLKKELYELIQKDPKIFDFIQHSALDGLWYWDIENMEEEWMNPKFWTTLGYDPEKMPHKSSAWQDIINPDDLKVAFDNCQRHFKDPSHKYEQIVRYTHKEGHTVWIQCRGLAIRDNAGEPLRMLGAHTDVTSLKEKEEELKNILEVTTEQNERLKNFAHIVSHNLRSHSSNFEMLLSVFFAEYPELETNELLSHLKTASLDLKETIVHLNEIVSINTTIYENLKEINVSDALKKCIANLDFLAKTSNTRIINNIDKDLIVLGVQSYIDSILYNFISNGIKYRAKHVDSFVSISSEANGDYVILKIEDNGLGIDLNKNGAKLFGMYKTFHGNNDAKGIGLFITNNQVKAIGGKIEVESELHKGTTFKIYLKHG